MKVTVIFRGICTHIRNGSLDHPTDVRVVLVNARFGLYAEAPIPPHTAKLHVPPPFIASAPAAIGGLSAGPDGGSQFMPSEWLMNGVELEIFGSFVETSLTTTADYRNLPSLTAIANRPLDVDHRIVDGGAAACVFRIRNGVLDAFRADEAIHGVLTVEIEGPAQLRVMRMWDRSTAHIELRPVTVDGKVHEPAIVVSNTGVDDDKNVDFVLHYGVTSWMPPAPLEFPPIHVRPATPEERQMLGIEPIFGDTVTHGCSNSIYP